MSNILEHIFQKFEEQLLLFLPRVASPRALLCEFIACSFLQ